MAAVMITKDLKNSVGERINRIARAEIAEECPHINETFTLDASDLVMQSLWEEYMHVADAIPKSWLKQISSSTVNVTVPLDGGVMTVGVNFVGLTRAWARPNSEGYPGYSASPSATLQWVKDHSHLTGAAQILERANDALKAREINEKYQGIKLQVLNFLDKCRSLNEAVKMMPSLKHYLDNDYIRRLEKKAERKTAEQQRAEELLAEIDQEQLTAIATAAKLQGVR